MRGKSYFPEFGDLDVMTTSAIPLASSPELILAPKDFIPEMLRPLADDDYDWKPERSPDGPNHDGGERSG